MNEHHLPSHPPGELILVLGATGKTGRRIAARLQALDRPIRIGSRGASPVFDWTQPASWDPPIETRFLLCFFWYTYSNYRFSTYRNPVSFIYKHAFRLIYKHISNNSPICPTFTKVFAHIIPDAATAGTPIPGIVVSPTRYNPFMGVWVPGNIPLPATIAGP